MRCINSVLFVLLMVLVAVVSSSHAQTMDLSGWIPLSDDEEMDFMRDHGIGTVYVDDQTTLWIKAGPNGERLIRKPLPLEFVNGVRVEKMVSYHNVFRYTDGEFVLEDGLAWVPMAEKKTREEYFWLFTYLPSEVHPAIRETDERYFVKGVQDGVPFKLNINGEIKIFLLNDGNLYVRKAQDQFDVLGERVVRGRVRYITTFDEFTFDKVWEQLDNYGEGVYGHTSGFWFAKTLDYMLRIEIDSAPRPPVRLPEYLGTITGVVLEERSNRSPVVPEGDAREPSIVNEGVSDEMPFAEPVPRPTIPSTPSGSSSSPGLGSIPDTGSNDETTLSQLGTNGSHGDAEAPGVVEVPTTSGVSTTNSSQTSDAKGSGDLPGVTHDRRIWDDTLEMIVGLLSVFGYEYDMSTPEGIAAAIERFKMINDSMLARFNERRPEPIIITEEPTDAVLREGSTTHLAGTTGIHGSTIAASGREIADSRVPSGPVVEQPSTATSQPRTGERSDASSSGNVPSTGQETTLVRVIRVVPGKIIVNETPALQITALFEVENDSWIQTVYTPISWTGPNALHMDGRMFADNRGENVTLPIDIFYDHRATNKTLHFQAEWTFESIGTLGTSTAR